MLTIDCQGVKVVGEVITVSFDKWEGGIVVGIGNWAWQGGLVWDLLSGNYNKIISILCYFFN